MHVWGLVGARLGQSRFASTRGISEEQHAQSVHVFEGVLLLLNLVVERVKLLVVLLLGILWLGLLLFLVPRWS